MAGAYTIASAGADPAGPAARIPRGHPTAKRARRWLAPLVAAAACTASGTGVPETPGGNGDGASPSLVVRLLDVRQRPIARLAAGLQNHGDVSASGPDGVALADPLALTDPTEEDPDYTNFYDFDFERVRHYGAAGSLQMVRVHLRRLERSWIGEDAGITDPAALAETTELIDTYIGTHWTEYKRREDRFCACEPPPIPPPTGGPDLCTRLGAGDAGGYVSCSDVGSFSTVGGGSLFADDSGRWDVFFEPGDPRFGDEGARAVMVRERDEAFCLRFGHRPDGSDEGCRRDATSVLSGFEVLAEEDPALADRPRAEELLGVEHRRFVVPETSEFTTPSSTDNGSATAYILWRTGDPDEPGTLRYQLADVIQPRRDASVHAFGGQFGDMFRDVTAKDTLNPGRPALSSIGLPYDLVPPLENELSDDGDSVESSHDVYVRNAERAASHASRLMQQARDVELESLRNDRSDSALLDEAQQAERETVAESCGTAAGCDLDRREELRLGSLTVDGAPFVPTVGELAPTSRPEIFPPDSAVPEPRVVIRTSGNSSDDAIVRCSELVTNFVSGFSLEGVKFKHWQKYVNDYMIGGLACSRWQLLTAANAATVQDVPEVVIAEVLSGGDGDFSGSSGQVREILITMFQDLMNLRAGLRGFQASYRASVSEVVQAAQRVDELNSSKGRRLRCKIGKALAVIGTVVAGVATSVVTLGAGAAGAVVAIVAVATAVASTSSSVIGTVSGGKCNGSKKKAAIEVERTLASTLLALENLQGITDETRRAAGKVAIGDARIDRLQRRVELAEQRRAIRGRIIDANSLADLQEWQALQTFQVDRARRALRRAQQQAFVARRAVEFRLGDDLATMAQPEPFVEAPGTWANDLFTVDTASSAMGAEDTPGTAHTNVSGEAMVDYVQKLGDFVRGYPFERRFRDATDVQMLRLDNLARNQVEFVDGEGTEDPPPFYSQLVYECNDVPASIPGSVFLAEERAPCSTEGGVARATFTFAVPQRFQGYLADRLAIGSFNYRHQRMAFNFVGTSIIDCTRAERPSECYTDGNLQYSFEQSGAVFVENFEREIHLFFPGPTRIARGRALVAERVLTNPLSSADRGLISPFERIEYNGRPLRGVYTLTIHGRPEIRWENLETVQWMIDYRYWTRQE